MEQCTSFFKSLRLHNLLQTPAKAISSVSSYNFLWLNKNHYYIKVTLSTGDVLTSIAKLSHNADDGDLKSSPFL